VNTGWSGGSYGVGQRLDIGHTRALMHAVLDGSLSQAPMITEPLFGLAVPSACPGVPAEILNPRNTWSDKAAYDAQAQKLAGMFAENFKTFADQVSPEVRQSGPLPQ
jgi:phosphoenolpyruvate carboxykinase (ATP)